MSGAGTSDTLRASCCVFVLSVVAACGAGHTRERPTAADAAAKPIQPDASEPSEPALRDASSPQPDAGGGALLSPEQLRDPETCKGCHPAHYREWSSSMHAYAALDPVFVAMNKRGQRETGGQLREFCVKCHAPMAVVDGLTQDGLNLAELPDQKRGVSCYFCHNVVGIDGDHNAQLRIAADDVMRGPIRDPVPSGAHRAAFSEVFDHDKTERNAMCGGCHDIVMPSGVELERTYQEYRHGLYAQQPSESAPALESCAGCHMPGHMALAAVAPSGTAPRTVHEHLWPGVDVALGDFPNREALRSAIEDCQLGLASVAFFTLEVTPPDTFTFRLETNAGHNMPSGAAQDRRLWLEFLAYDADGGLIEAASSGNIGATEIADKPADDPRHDPKLWLFRDRLFGAQGEPRHMFWEAAPSPDHPSGYESNTLEVRKETLGLGTHFIEKVFHAAGPDGTGTPARITARLRLRPVGRDVLQDLVDSGDLDPAVLSRVPTLTLGAQLEWTQADGFMKTISAQVETDCERYRCLLEPESSRCP